jgi:iron complex outermembrane receptor protein
MLNMRAPLGSSNASFYAFGGFNQKWSDAYAFTRSWNSKPERFPTDGNGNLIYVPSIMYSVNNGDGSFDTVYNPHIQTHVQDASLSAGVEWKTNGGWNWDVSNTIGGNNFHYFGDKTFNASLGAEPNHLDDGGFSFLQNAVNADLSKKLPSVARGLNLAFGGEFRFENYKIYKGEEASWQLYDVDKAPGSQGYPGYRPADEVNDDRTVEGVYADAELDATEAWLLGGAVRYEHYSDFGSTLNFKFDTRYKLAHEFNLRGSFSSGFRAPSLAQINFSNTFTTVQAGNILEVKIAPNYSEIAKAAGIPNLQQEKSLNASLGFAWKALPELTITVDGYWVQIKDRVVLSGQFSADDPDLDPALTDVLKELKVAYAQFFANAVNTTNTGVDIVFDYKKRFGGNKHFNALLTGNIQSMTIDKINVPEKLSGTETLRKTFYSDREQKFLLASAPKQKFALSLEYGLNKLAIGARVTYFGKIDLYGYGEDGSGIDPKVPTDANPDVYVADQYIYGGKFVPDVYLSYKLCKGASLFIGADNFTNVHPDYGFVQSAKYWAFNNETGGPWDAVQMGFNGIHLFAKLAFNF